MLLQVIVCWLLMGWVPIGNKNQSIIKLLTYIIFPFIQSSNVWMGNKVNISSIALGNGLLILHYIYYIGLVLLLLPLWPLNHFWFHTNKIFQLAFVCFSSETYPEINFFFLQTGFWEFVVARFQELIDSQIMVRKWKPPLIK